jgi:hypothetical protein
MWAQQFDNNKNWKRQVFEFMDDAWQMQWEDGERDKMQGTFKMIHRGMKTLLFKRPQTSPIEFARLILKAIGKMMVELSKYNSIHQKKPAYQISKLKHAESILNSWLSKRNA